MCLGVLSIALLAALGVTANAQKDDLAKKDLQRMQGTWKVIKAIRDGETESDDDRRNVQLVIEGDKITVKKKDSDVVAVLHIAIDPSKKPAVMDMLVGEDKVTVPGIYALDKDTLKLCYGEKDRPKRFASKPGSGKGLVILRRAKK